MKVNSATLRRLVPAAAVAGVLAISYMAQAPSLASNNDVGYGYRNNCGVKGDGFHDHGKPCPNRPFPGKGKGVMAILGLAPSPSESNGSTTSATETDNMTTGSEGSGTTTNSGKGHSHGKGHRPGNQH
jgi:hypothetical protein